MRKKIWGYSISETDELIDSLKNQISVLTGKLTNLHTEYSAVLVGIHDDESSQIEITKLKDSLDKSEKDNLQLRASLMQAKAELSEQKAKVDFVGQIYLKAYEDAAAIKAAANAILEEAKKEVVKYNRKADESISTENGNE